MKNYFKIAAFIALLFLLTAEDCGPGYNAAEQAETIESAMFRELESSFVAEGLDAKRLQALEQRAIQKFYELSEYMQLYADTALDMQFRRQARQMMVKTFVSEVEFLNFIVSLDFREDLGQYLLLNTQGEPATFNWKFPVSGNPFLHSPKGYKTQLDYMSQNKKKVIGVLATKKTKVFGDQTLLVWELFFEPASPN